MRFGILLRNALLLRFEHFLTRRCDLRFEPFSESHSDPLFETLSERSFKMCATVDVGTQSESRINQSVAS